MTGDLYERRHMNGWVATAEATSDDLFKANAREGGADKAYWAEQRIPDLPTAQQKADDRVPQHDCRCPAWTIKSAATRPAESEPHA